MINIQKGDVITYNVSHLEMPEALSGRRFKNIEKVMMNKNDVPTHVTIGGIVIEPFTPLSIDVTGLLEVTYDGVRYHEHL